MMERQFIFHASDLRSLFEALERRGYRILGPRARDGAIVYDEVRRPEDLPVGMGDVQEGGHYRLTHREDGAFFGYGLGPQSWKRFLSPPCVTLFRARREERGFRLLPDPDDPPPRLAFLGVRACELAALAIQDRVNVGGAYADPAYRARREAAFVVAVTCGEAGHTCFCASMGTGPRAASGFDLLLTELDVFGRHDFVMEVGSERGAEVAAEVPHHPASDEDLGAVEALLRRAVETQGRSLDTRGLKELLYRSYESPHWNEVARRCLTCANCTMVCPTCFCTTVEDTTDLAGATAERQRRWDSCFTMEFSYVHGGSVRMSAGARYRQWITHKLATWHEQFGTSGCVGCGRCITWCPVGIDLTEEVRALRSSEGGRSDASPGI
jgi:formate hydrogenlyase subunit 6/NADH:ubiquinone oxidoreductase subunit I